MGNQSRATSGRVERKDEPSWFLQLDGVKIKDRSNQSCGEPELGYFRKSGEKGLTKLVFSSAGWSEDQGSLELVVWGTKVVLLQ